MKRVKIRNSRNGMAVLAVLAFTAATGCSKPVDQGIIENRNARDVLAQAADKAMLAEHDEALRLLEQAEKHAQLAMRLTRSKYTYGQAEMVIKEIGTLRAKVTAAKMEREASKAQEQAAQSGLGQPVQPQAGYWQRTPGQTAGPAGAAAAGSGVDISGEEAAARTSRLGARRPGARVDGATEAELLGQPQTRPSEAGVESTIASGASREPVVVTKIERKNRAVAVHVVFNNPGNASTLGSVTGSLRNENDKEIVPMFFGFLAKGFKPNWDDIFASQGEGLAAGESGVAAGGSIGLVLVADTDEAAKAKSAVVTVTLQNEQSYSGKGPK